MRNTICTLVITSFCTLGIASAQLVSFGVKGGVSLTDPDRYKGESKRYIVGPSVEVRLPLGFAVEVDALYRRVGSSFSYIFPTLNPDGTPANMTIANYNRQRGNSWEFPILAKYYFRSRSSAWQPFLATGYAFRATWYESKTTLLTIDNLKNTVQTNAFK